MTCGHDDSTINIVLGLLFIIADTMHHHNHNYYHYCFYFLRLLILPIILEIIPG